MPTSRSIASALETERLVAFSWVEANYTGSGSAQLAAYDVDHASGPIATIDQCEFA